MSTPAITPPPTQSAQAAPQAPDGVPMSFRDGSTAMVPKEKVSDAMLTDGAELLHAVQFPDKSTAWVRHSDLASAFHEGGTRLDANPNASKPVRWQDAVGSTWDMLTGTGMEAGPAAAQGGGGDSISKGLTNAGSGHPIKGAAQVASGVAEGISPALGASALPESMLGSGVKAVASAASGASSTAEKAVADVAKDIPQASTWQGLKELYEVGEKQWQKAEVGGDKLEHAAWQTIAQEAMDKATAAANAGEGIAANGYNAAARAASAMGKWHDIWAQLGQQYPKLPVGMRLLYTYELAKGAYSVVKFATDQTGITSPDKDEARDVIWNR